MERISIHALLAESDQHLCICVIELIHFYPRSPCGERPRPQPPKARVLYFYPRSPCGERQAANGLAHAPPEISIHALLAESDGRAETAKTSIGDFYPRSPCGERRGLMGGSNCDRNFYPRSPCGERHTKHFPALHHILISIHALLAESDAGAGNNAIGISYFYPRSPCGERPANNE